MATTRTKATLVRDFRADALNFIQSNPQGARRLNKLIHDFAHKRNLKLHFELKDVNEQIQDEIDNEVGPPIGRGTKVWNFLKKFVLLTIGLSIIVLSAIFIKEQMDSEISKFKNKTPTFIQGAK